MAGTYSRILLHFVFATKERTPLIQPDWRDRLHGYIGGIVRESGGVLIAAGGIPDHIHLLVKMPTDLRPSDLMRLVKSNSSRWINEEIMHGRFAWQESYAVFSVGPTGEQGVVSYIHNQEKHHLGIDSASELRHLLSEAGVEWDDRYFE